MTCAEASQLIGPWVDDELDVRSAVELSLHLARCAECERERSEVLALRDTARERLPLDDPSPQLDRRVWEAVRAAARRSRHWVRDAGLMAAAACVAVAVTVSLQRGSGALRDEIVDAHVRSLQVQHLTDVASSDQHTVKPWFHGKIDFACPTRDFSEQGFVLAGGRLDVVGGRAVAAIVYRRRQHVLNLFVWPAERGETEARSFTARGYRIASWAQAGLEYRLVSDIPEEEADQLVALLREAAATRG
jgi:anti-sigma factor RsiW